MPHSRSFDDQKVIDDDLIAPGIDAAISWLMIFNRLPPICGVIAIVMGSVVLAGWAFGVPISNMLVPGAVTMKPWTAVCFVLAGTGLVIFSTKSRPIVPGFLISGIIFLVGAATLVEYATATSIIDILVFPEAVRREATPIPGRMAIFTAVNFVLLGAALFLAFIGSKRATLICQVLTILLSCSSLLSVAGYLFQSESLHTIQTFSTIAFHTAILFLIVASAVIFLRPETGITRIFIVGGMAGKMSRFLIPAGLIVPLLLGWFRLQGEIAGYYDGRFGLAVFACATIIILVGLIWKSALNIERAEVERQSAYVGMSRSESKFKTLALALSEVLWDLKASRLEEVEAPKWWTTITGQTDEEVKGLGWISAIHPEDTPATVEKFNSGFERSMGWNHRFRLRSTKGSYRHLDLVCVPVFEKDGSIRQWIGTVNDITAEREAEARVSELHTQLERKLHELEIANSDLASFSYSISHDLRAPLRAMDGFSHALLEDYPDALDDSGKLYLERIRAASKRMSEMVDALLVLSRVTRSDLTIAAVELSTLASEAAGSLQESEPSRKVRFEIEPGITAKADAKMMRVVLENLLNNAWKFTSKKEEAIIAFGKLELDGKIFYYVRDNGAGFEMKYAEKMFGPFQRLHNPSDFEGSGIGLATVQRVIRRHGGTISGEGDLGHGATFYFSL